MLLKSIHSSLESHFHYNIASHLKSLSSPPFPVGHHPSQALDQCDSCKVFVYDFPQTCNYKTLKNRIRLEIPLGSGFQFPIWLVILVVFNGDGMVLGTKGIFDFKHDQRWSMGVLRFHLRWLW